MPSYYSSIVTISLGGTAVKAIKVSKTVLPNRNGCEDIYRAAIVMLKQLKTATLSCVIANKPVQIVYSTTLYVPVCPSVTSQSSMEMAEHIELVFGTGASFDLS